MLLGKEARVSKRLLAGAVGNGVMRCDCSLKPLSEIAKAPIAQSQHRKYLSLPQGKSYSALGQG